MNFDISSMHTMFEAASSKDGDPIVNQDINMNPKDGEANDSTGANLNNTLGQSDLNAIFDDICPISGDVYASMKNAASDPKNLKIAMVKSGEGENADLFVEAVEFMTFCEAAECTVGEAVEKIVEAYGEDIPALDNAEFHVVFPSDSVNKGIIGGENLGRDVKNDWAMQLMRGCRRYGLKVNAGVSVEPSEEKEMLGEGVADVAKKAVDSAKKMQDNINISTERPSKQRTIAWLAQNGHKGEEFGIDNKSFKNMADAAAKNMHPSNYEYMVSPDPEQAEDQIKRNNTAIEKMGIKTHEAKC